MTKKINLTDNMMEALDNVANYSIEWHGDFQEGRIDGRTIRALENRGLIEWGDNMCWSLTDKGEEVIAGL